MKKLLRHPRSTRVLAALIAAYARVVFATSRVRVVTPVPAVLAQGPVFFAFWHQHIFTLPVIAKPSPFKLMGLMSASRDGTLTKAIGKWYGVEASVGSSHRGAIAGARGLVQAARSGRSLFLTPDGPRGPIYVAKPGATEIARLTKLPLVPCAAWPTHGKTFASWDNFRLPYPFTTFYVAYAQPLQTLTPQALQSALNTLTAQAQAASAALATPPSKL